MKIAHSQADDNPRSLQDLAEQLNDLIQTAARDGKSLYDTEKSVLSAVLKMGHVAIENFLKLQGEGNLGDTVETDDGKILVRSPEPTARPLRTIFGEHVITAFVYATGPKKKIELRPVDARLNLAAEKGSYLWEEFSQYFCVEQAFGQAASALETVFGQKISVDTLERTNQRLGEQAEQFLDTLPIPPSDEEGELLVATADGKGVPLIREHVKSIPVHGPKPPRPNNRRMATVASVYSVDRYCRTPEDVLAALFRDERPDKPTEPRPVPCHKRMTACFSVLAEAGTEDELMLRGDTNAWTWAGKQVKDRRRKRQVLIRLCDGQPSLWAASDVCLELDLQRDLESKSSTPSDEGPVVDILDIIHVAGYVWSAARAFFGKAEASAEQFARERLLRILRGEVLGVITGMRAMATRRKLSGEKLKKITTTCNYFKNNLERMRYDEYLSRGYPIASGVIEGACRHLVKDRMERTGMRWQQPSAGSMLFVRSLAVTGLWDEFQAHRQAEQQTKIHPHRAILGKYTPTITIAA